MYDTRLYEAHILSPLPTFESLKIPFSQPQISPTTNLHRSLSSILPFSISRRKMAQKTEKEETTELKVPETLTLCANNCGFTGNPATNNMCQKCFNATAAGILDKFSGAESARSGSPLALERSDPASDAPAESSRDPSPDRLPAAESTTVMSKREVNRCSGCGRKVGLTGFRCRCGELFCAEHRYSDRHYCSYDYKTAGREAIARENPVVKAAKIVRV
ncbi:zinc finger A20 and AN1 domain-containing stress-associated protein 5 [Malania oleifera]|uniref:zinc finger A20 and AN1 domain-containing stress-associated protein 5 n=1 Tax=Malania oleifera TaxID=397392 RepID=UPI0025AE7700|nr:zinc finger A20 and AN1 domain-containing stress-associated protein 5 [Malania oleifera]